MSNKSTPGPLDNYHPSSTKVHAEDMGSGGQRAGLGDNARYSTTIKHMLVLRIFYVAESAAGAWMGRAGYFSKKLGGQGKHRTRVGMNSSV